MFKLAEKRTITWPVTVSIPQDGGKVTKATFSVEFEALKQDELEDLTAQGKDVLDAVIVGWPENAVKGENDEPVAFSPEAKTELLKITYVRNALFAAYAELQNGRAAARKN